MIKYLLNVVRLVSVYSVVISLTACAPAASTRTARPGIHELGRIGIISPTIQPDTKITGLPPRGTADGAITGTAAGSLAGAFECIPFLFPPPAYPVCVAVFAAVGLGAGAGLAESQEIVDSAREKFTRVLTERNWQALLRLSVVKLAAEKYPISVADLGTPKLLAEGINPADTAQTSGHVHQAEIAHVPNVVPSALLSEADTLLEVTLVKLSTWFSGDHKFGFVLTGQAQLIRSSDLVVLTSSTHYYVSPSLPLSQWLARDGAPIGETVMAGIDYLAQEMVHEQLQVP